MLNHGPASATTVRRFLSDGSGATAIEYGLIVGLIAVAILVGLGDTHDGVVAMFAHVLETAGKALNGD